MPMPRGIPNSRSHGSGQACAKRRITPRCLECRTYRRAQLAAEYARPDSFRRKDVNDSDKRRYRKRRAAIRKTEAELEALCRS